MLESARRCNGLRSSEMLISPGDERALGYGGCLYHTPQRSCTWDR